MIAIIYLFSCGLSSLENICIVNTEQNFKHKGKTKTVGVTYTI